MDNKNVRTIDEHGIDRVARIITGLNVSGSNYVVYTIERKDEDNKIEYDNLFVSLLLRNNDGTSQMINIDDSLEKDNISNVVKELVTMAVNDSNERLSGDMVTLADGRSVNTFDVLFNKEQNINVVKTYITSIKLPISKIIEDYYRKDKNNTLESPSSEAEQSLELPEINLENKNQEIISQPIVSATPEILESSVNNEPVIELPDFSTEIGNEEKKDAEIKEEAETREEVSVSNEAVAPIFDLSDNNLEEVKPITPPEITPISSDGIKVEPVLNVSPVPENNNTNVPSVSEIKEEPVVNELASEPISTPLVFDASKESNLNIALGEVTTDKSITTPEVEPIREFGEEPEDDLNQESSKVLTRKLGFAQSKFFLVVAILFFVASCIFLGYEVFKYFNNVG